MKYAVMAALAAFVPALALGAPSQSAAGLLANLPPLPGDAGAAYAQWTDANGELAPGPAFTGAQAAIQNATTADAQAMAGAAPGMPSGAPPASDIALAKTIGPYPDYALRTKLANLMMNGAQVDAQWQQAEAALHDQMEAGMHKLPACSWDKTGYYLPADQVSALVKTYDSGRAALAATYLGKTGAVLQQIGALVKPEAAYADTALANWAKLQSAQMKSMLHAPALGAHTSALVDVGQMLTFEMQESKHAAAAIAAKNTEARQLAGAKQGCTGPL